MVLLVNFPMKSIPLTQGQTAIVDDADYDWLNQWKWCARRGNKTFYARRAVVVAGKYQEILMHRLLLSAPCGIRVDHKDFNGLHNWRKNIRLATPAQNQFNHPLRSTNKSGFVGVCWKTNRSKWYADIRVNGVKRFVGYFLTPEEAARARDKAALQARGEFAFLNFPEVLPL
jgi:hypothetical protein